MIFKKSRVYQGFTLIELIVVIVVIGILAAFVTISYFGISEKARRNSLAFNTQSILRTIKVKKSTDDSFVATDIDASNLTSQLGMNADNYSEILISYTTDDYAYVVGQKTFSDLIACGTQDNIKVYGADDAECPLGGSPYSVEKVTDTIGLDGTGTCSSDPYLIESIEDLVTFSNTVNGIGVTANNFSGKCVMLMTSLDFQQSKSYINAGGTDFGDVNGNGTVEGLKKELTTGQGFRPIGDNTTSAKRFAGTFRGVQNSIYNMYINRNVVDNIGLFGYITGTVANVKLIGVNVTGRDYTAGLVGNNFGTIYDVEATGNLTGNNRVGLVAGYADFYKHITSVIVEGNVTGNDCVGGIIGYDYYSTIRGINKGGSITSNGNIGRLTGYDPYTFTVGVSINSVTLNGSTVSNTSPDNKNGLNIDSLSDLNNLPIVELALDTYIGADNDGDGYYWDYNDSGVVIKKNTTDNPLNTSLSGTGTSNDPYLVSSVNDLKQVNLQLSKFYKLSSNLDMTGQKEYTIGSRINPFTGTFDGNFKTIENFSINSPESYMVGLFGQNNGNIKYLTLSNANIVGGNYVGVVAGSNESGATINTVNVVGNVTGKSNVGLVVGRANGSTYVINVRAQGNATGISNVGGITGYIYTSHIRGVYEGGAVIATSSNAGRIAGYNCVCGGSISALAMDSVTVNGLTVSSFNQAHNNGLDITSLDELNNLYMAEVAFDTYIGGDNDSDGYYWDYSDANIVHKNISDFPLVFDLSGSGTSDDPYLIEDYNDLKKASSRLSASYKLVNSLDMTGIRFYPLGSNNNTFSGTFDGNDKTISNISVDAINAPYTAFIGKNNGTIKHLNLTDIDFNGGNYTAGVVGSNTNSSTINNINVTGNVSGLYTVGMIVADAGGNSKVFNVTTQGDVSGISRVGGIAGYKYVSHVRGINKGGTVTSSDSYVGRTLGYNCNCGGSISTLAMTSTIINGSTVSSSSQNSNNGLDLTNLSELNNIYMAEVAYDTYIGGDNDADGYYWDYDGGSVVRKDVSTYPLTFSLSGSGTSADPYLISNYTELRQASLKNNVYYKLTADIDLSGYVFYPLGSYTNIFTGNFDGNAKTISNININAIRVSHQGFIGNNKGVIKGLVLSNINVVGGDYTAGLTGYNSGTIKDIIVTGSVNGLTRVGLICGDNSTSITSVVVEGNVTGTGYTGGIAGYNYTTAIKGINRGGAIVNTGSYIYRLGGRAYFSDGFHGAAVAASTTLNGSTVVSSSYNNHNGLDILYSDLANSATYTPYGFNFTDENLDYIWYIDGDVAKFREGAL